MRKTAVLTAVFLLSSVFLRADSVDANHFLIFPDLNGASGFIANPAAYCLPDSKISLGIHMEKFLFKANYGYKDLLEGGVNINFGTSASFLEIIKTFSVNIKCSPIREEQYFVSAAAGIERFPLYYGDKSYWDNCSIYAVLSKKVPDWNMNFTAGVRKKAVHNYLSFMADASKVIGDTVLAVAEFDDDHFNAGLKVSLNYSINVEFYVKNIGAISKAGEIGDFLREYFVFGITYLQ